MRRLPQSEISTSLVMEGSTFKHIEVARLFMKLLEKLCCSTYCCQWAVSVQPMTLLGDIQRLQFELEKPKG